MERLCPSCGNSLEYDVDHWYCLRCQTNYRLRGRCNVCNTELERLAACGATNWFCPQCNELKSKSAVRTELIPIKE